MNRSKSNYGSMMLIALCAANFIPNYAQYQLSPFAVSIMDELNITASQFSSLFTAPMIPAILLSLLAGIMVDKFNPKLVMGTAIGITMAGTILSVYSNSYLMLFSAFVMIGVGAAFINCNQAKLISGWYSPEQVTGKMGIVMGASTIAMAVALATTSFFTSRKAASTVSALGAVLAFCLWIFLYKSPEKNSQKNNLEKIPGVIDGLKVVVKNKHIYTIAACLMAIMGANVVIGSFAPTALQERGIDAVAAGTYSALYTIGCFLSCFIAPALASKLKSVKIAVMIFAVLAFAGTSLSVNYVPEGILLGIAMLLSGVFVGGSIPLLCGLPVQLKGIGPAYAGTAGGLISTIQLIGAVVIPGKILVPISGGNYQVLFWAGGFCMLVCAVIALLLPKTD